MPRTARIEAVALTGAAARAMFVAHYNFIWRTRHADKSSRPGKLRPTAAMMAKVTDHL
jgi:hypothetical protein